MFTAAPQLRRNDNARWFRNYPTLTPFAIGAALAGAAAFAASGAVGSALGAGSHEYLVTVLLSAVAMTYGVAHLMGWGLWMPNTYKQVPLIWREVLKPPVANFLYGLGLGIGAMTKVPFATFYVLMAICWAAADPLTGCLTGAAFGLARAMPNVYYRYRGLRLGEMDRVFEELDPLEPAVRRANGLALVATAAILSITNLA